MTNDTPTIAPVTPAEDPLPPASSKPSTRRVILQMLAGMAVGVVVGVIGARLLAGHTTPAERGGLRRQLGPWTLPVLIPLLILAAYFGIVVHELGHVAGGLLARFRFYLFVAGPLRVERDPDSGRVRVGLNRTVSMMGGLAALLPTGTHDLWRRFGLLIAGGPLGSLALAVGAWALAAFGPPLSPLGKAVVEVTAIMSAGLLIATLLPMRTGGYPSDGARLLRLMRGGPAGMREAAMLPLISLSVGETPPREWPRDLVDAVVAARDASSEECFGNLLAYCHALDLGDVPLATRRMERMVALIPAVPRTSLGGLHLEAAFFAGAWLRDAARARAHLAGIPPRVAVRPYDRARSDAALAIAEGDLPRARTLAAQALAGLPGRAAFRRDSLAAALARAEADVSASGAS